MKNKVILYIDLVLFGLESKTIKFAFMKSTLESIDKLTYLYENEENFFERKKTDILKRLKFEALTYNITIPPTDIEMGSEGIYIEKDERKILPLFKTIKVKNVNVKLEDLIKKKMLNGNLFVLYTCDKKRQFDPEYESIFESCSTNVLERIALNCYCIADIELLWDFLQSKNRFYSIVRFLLRSGSIEELEEKFMNDIPLLEKSYQTIREESPKLERYRYPYIDD